MTHDARRSGDSKPVPSPQAAPASPSSAPGAATLASSPPAPADVVLLGPPTADGAGVHVIRARDERLEAGELRALQDGRPIVGEVVTLKPRQDNPRVCDVEASYAAPTTTSHKGPAKVATQAYREGWDEIFGGVEPQPPSPRDLN